MEWADAFVPRLLLGRSPHGPRAWHDEATLVLLDISGFTSLSEQLAQRGREGAEDLVSTLNRLYTVLLSASDDGGDVIKFGGDALLLRHAGPDHAARACYAALSMQRVLRAVGSVHLTGARTRLRMSVGVHTGVFEHLLTGTTHLNLVVTGRALDRLLDLEKAADAGQVLVSAEVAAAVRCTVRPRPDGELQLLRMPSHPGRPAGEHARAGAIAPWLPPVFAERPDLLAAESDHRHAAMGFVQVEGLGSVPADDRGPLVDRLTRAVDDTCVALGVTLLDTDPARDGYRYFLTAGAPVAVEDAGGRLTSAAHRIVAAAPDGLSVRAGVTAGRLFAGAVGAPTRRTYSAMGDATNLAARLAALAAPGEVLVEAGVVRRARTVFEATAREPVTVRGRSGPVPLVQVHGESGVRRSPDAEVPFIGRAAELAALGSALEVGSLVELVGDPGVGTSRLAREAARRSGRPVVEQGSDPSAPALAHRGLHHLLRPLLGLTPDVRGEAAGAVLTSVVEERAPALLPWLPLLAPAVDAVVPPTASATELDDRFRTGRFHDALRSLLRVLLPDDALVLLHDVQWLDPTSAEALAASLPALAPRHAVVVTRRPDPGSWPGVDDGRRIDVDGLPEDDARRLLDDLVEDLVARPLRDPVARRLVRRAAGNPTFLVELAGSPGLGDGQHLPDRVEELVASRIDDLDPSARGLLRTASVLGASFGAALLEQMAGRPVAGLLDADLAPFLAVRDGVVSFRRDLHRDVAYGQLSFRRRRAGHAQVVATLTADPGLATTPVDAALSFHATAAADWPRAWTHSRAAALAARDTWAHEEAVVLAERALDAGRRIGAEAADLAALDTLVADACVLAGRHSEAIAAYRRARRNTADPETRAVITEKLAMAHRGAGDLDGAVRAAADLRRQARGVGAAAGAVLLAEADLVAAGARFWQGRSAAARRLALAAAGRADEIDDPVARTRIQARAWGLHDTALIELEGRAGDYGDQPVRLFEQIGDLYNQGRFASNAAIGHFYDGDWDRAVDLYRESLGIAERIGDVFAVEVARMNIGELLALQGHATEAVALLEEAARGLRALETAIAEASAEGFLGLSHRVAGNLDAADAAFGRARSAYERAGSTHQFMHDDLTTRELEVLVARGLADEVDAVAGALVDAAGTAGVHRCRALRSRGVARDSADDLAGSLALAEGNPYERALTLLAIGTAPARAEAASILEPLGVVGPVGPFSQDR